MHYFKYLQIINDSVKETPDVDHTEINKNSSGLHLCHGKSKFLFYTLQ